MDKLKIFTLDNDEDALKIIKTACRNHILRVEKRSLHAMEIIKSERFHIFIINHMMPGMNGMELLACIKETYTHTPYVGILSITRGTTHLFNEELVRGLFSYFIEKPYTISMFKDIFKKALVKMGKIKNRDETQDTTNGNL